MWTAILLDGSTHTDNFRDIMDKGIAKLSTSDVRPLEVDMVTGEVFIEGQLVTRQQVNSHYGRGPYRPIQYRKVTQLISLAGDGSPDKEFVNQYIGYVYNYDNMKVQVEFISDTEVNSIVMKEQVTDLVEQKIVKTNHTRLV